jgi:hypothetical protein
MALKKLPWNTSEYHRLDPDDFSPSPPTPERRIRIAAALATYMRDANMLGWPPKGNVETIRAVLTMDNAAWARDIGSIRGVVDSYDAVDPKVRFEQVRR